MPLTPCNESQFMDFVDEARSRLNATTKRVSRTPAQTEFQISASPVILARVLYNFHPSGSFEGAVHEVDAESLAKLLGEPVLPQGEVAQP